ncbi:MAG: TonB-dependent receptor [Gemmatimonadales bacterium]
MGGTAGLWSGSAGFTRAQSDGFRQHSASDTRQLTLGLNRIIGDRFLAQARYVHRRAPGREPRRADRGRVPARARQCGGQQHPSRRRQGGPPAPTRRDPDRGAGRRLRPRGHRLRPRAGSGQSAGHRPARGQRDRRSGPTSAIDRVAGGARVAWRQRLGGRNTRLALGVDAQTMRDDRINRRSNGGPERYGGRGSARTGHGVRSVREPSVEPMSRLLLTGTIRYDRVRFTVADRFLSDGSDDSGERSMGAVSASGGVSWALPAGAWYLNVGSAFETPTTTELVALPTGRVGLNANLGPQRTASVETGVRLRGTHGGLTAAMYRSAVHDALIQAREQDGRAVFENAGRLRIQGVELGLDWRPARILTVGLTYTHTDATYRDYRIRSGATVDTLDGNEVPGIPRHLFRGFATGTFGPVVLEWEQQLVAAFFADDRNAIEIPGQGAGVTDVRIRLALPGGERLAMTPFAGVSNLFDRGYVAAATVNGFGGRTFEPAPGRWFHLGLDARFRL